MTRYLTVILLLLPFLAHAGHLAHVEIYDRTAGMTLPVYEHGGRRYVVGEPGHRYEIVVRNRSGGRLLAVTSVDGVNVVSGETAGTHQGGYVLDRWDSVAVDGWRKSLSDVAAFYFTRLPDSYAARTGRPDNVGVIGVALFREELRRVPPTEQRAGIIPPATPQGAPQSRESMEDRLGTGHGHRDSSPARYVHFRRASEAPDEIVSIDYDSRRNLTARGVLPSSFRFARETPDPFPTGFVPDP